MRDIFAEEPDNPIEEALVCNFLVDIEFLLDELPRRFFGSDGAGPRVLLLHGNETLQVGDIEPAFLWVVGICVIGQ